MNVTRGLSPPWLLVSNSVDQIRELCSLGCSEMDHVVFRNLKRFPYEIIYSGMVEEPKDAFEALQAFVKELDDVECGLVASGILNPEDGIFWKYLPEARYVACLVSSIYLQKTRSHTRSLSAPHNHGILIFLCHRSSDNISPFSCIPCQVIKGCFFFLFTRRCRCLRIRPQVHHSNSSHSPQAGPEAGCLACFLYSQAALWHAFKKSENQAQGSLHPLGLSNGSLEFNFRKSCQFCLTEHAVRLRDLSRCFLNHYHKGKAKGQVKGESLATLGRLFQANPEVRAVRVYLSTRREHYYAAPK